jgi:hypothetical protein
MSNRKTLSKRTRFEVFKRDQFTCQYCGKTPPGAVLWIDHILALANGGTDDSINLITACQDCNSGKAAVPLERKSPPIEVAQETERERFEQIKLYNEWLSEQRKVRDGWLKQVSDAWVGMIGRDPNEYEMSGEMERSVRVFLGNLPAERIVDALHIANSRIGYPKSNKFLKYFCGVCWRMIKGD